MSRNLSAQKSFRRADSVLRQQVLERLISEAVQVQLAGETGIRIDDAQLERSLERIAQQNGMNIVQFRAALEKMASTTAGKTFVPRLPSPPARTGGG